MTEPPAFDAGPTPAADPLDAPPGPRLRLIGFLLKRAPWLRYLMLRRRFLKDSGWVASSRANLPVDSQGQPVAWYTYSALQFLEGRVRPDMDILEFGAGNSTLWWAKRAGTVVSVESDRQWVDLLQPKLPENARVEFCRADVDGRYASYGATFGRRFDVVVIDGYDRNNCARNSLAVLKDGGVFVWDNSDWTQHFQEGMDFLEANGFRRVDFSGLGPLNGYGWTTSVFYRSGRNCFNL